MTSVLWIFILFYCLQISIYLSLQISQVLIPVANGLEEIELVTIVDILRRAKANVIIASVEKSLQILASRATKIIADKMISAAAESIYDLIILPVSNIVFHLYILFLISSLCASLIGQ